jgi:acyl-CoA synthetase (AMP-forming)/AMP-acid ligase II
MSPDRLPLWDLIEWRAARTPDDVMVVDEHDHTVTFGAYRDRCERVAAAFAATGVGPGTPVAWMLPTWIEALVLAGALARLGALQVPVLPILRERELGFILGQSGARHLVVPGEWRGFDYAAMAKALDVDVVTVVDRDLPEAEPAGLPVWTAPEDDPLRWVFYTSGTTANPKGVKHTDRTVAAAAHRLNLRFAMTADDRNALVFPVTHIGGISWLMGGLLAGYRHIAVEAFDPAPSCVVLRRNGMTVAGAGPVFWMAYVAEQRRTPDEVAFPDLRALVGGGAAKPPTLDDEVRQLLRVPLVTGYGSSECPGVSHSGVWDTADDLRADGHAMDDCELRIVDEDGRDCPPGVAGEIVVKGPMLFLGYLDPDEDDGIDADGWFHTSDVGTLDERGFLRVTGRLKDIIIRKGENISAKEVEDALHRHPAVLDAAAIALPDFERGELCCAVVVLHAGASLTLAELGEHCAGLGLARQKVPERLEVLEVLPRNATGKVLKPDLVARFGR